MKGTLYNYTLLISCFFWGASQVAANDLDLFHTNDERCLFNKYLNELVDFNEDSRNCLQVFSPALYSLQDFSLKKNYQYLEFRTASRKLEEDNLQVLAVFDNLGLSALTPEQKSAVINIRSDIGFRNKSALFGNTIYGVAVHNKNVETITSISQLYSLFNTIDTEAELYWWLWIHSYEALAYQEVSAGYIVYAKLNDDGCESGKQRKLFVDANGVITVLELFVSEHQGVYRRV